MPVVYNSGLFFCDHEWPAELGSHVSEQIEKCGLDEATRYFYEKGDLMWEERSARCLQKMRRKEIDEGVIPEYRMSDLLETRIIADRLLLTQNHPSSILFLWLTDKILKHLGYAGFRNIAELEQQARENLNLAQLPCEDFVCPSASRALGLNYFDPITQTAFNHCRGILGKYQNKL